MRERDSNPLHIVGPLGAFWIIVLVLCCVAWPDLPRNFLEAMVKVFWTIVPRHVHP